MKEFQLCREGYMYRITKCFYLNQSCALVSMLSEGKSKKTTHPLPHHNIYKYGQVRWDWEIETQLTFAFISLDETFLSLQQSERAMFGQQSHELEQLDF